MPLVAAFVVGALLAGPAPEAPAEDAPASEPGEGEASGEGEVSGEGEASGEGEVSAWYYVGLEACTLTAAAGAGMLGFGTNARKPRLALLPQGGVSGAGLALVGRF